ncbi:BTB/POZ domain-containing protein 6-like isoform X2 [Amblyomma americanum]
MLSFEKHLGDGELADLDIEVDFHQFPGQRGSFKAHRMILALQNDVFKTMFYGSFPKEDRVVITDLHPDGVLGLLRYFYSGRLMVETVVQAAYTRTAAVKYLVPELADKCVDYVRSNMNTDDVCPFLDYVLTMGEEYEYCPAKTLIRANSQGVLSSKSFQSCLVHTVSYILDHVTNVHEVSVVEAVHAWGEQQVSERSAGVEESAALREAMMPLFPKLRFLALTATEFIEGPNSWGVLKAEEALSILSNIIKEGSMPIPFGFSNIRVSRMKVRRPDTFW